ncbi:patatin-like phospholipase family protein [Pseudomonas mandelii]
MTASQALPESENPEPHSAAKNLQAALDAEALAMSKNPQSAFHGKTGNGRHLRETSQTVGLAFSGGGIRSATFCLGVLQALASRKRLASFDYLSTVSGGGYIGSWLSAWIHRKGLAEVQESLAQADNVNTSTAPASSEPAEIVWLRRYSNYLTPRVGMFSMDTLTLLATWMRNVLLNLIILLAFFALLFTLPYGLLRGYDALATYGHISGYAAAWGGLFFTFCIGYNLWHQGLRIKRERNGLISVPGVILTVIVPGVFSVVFAVIWWIDSQPGWDTAFANVCYLAGLLLALQLVWVLAELAERKPWKQLLCDTIVQCLAGAVALICGVLVIAAASYLLPVSRVDTLEYKIVLLCLAVPVFLAALGVTTTVYTGMVGRAYYERSREWWSRLNAWLMTIAFGWAIWCLLTFFSLPLLEWLQSHMGNWISLLGTGWIGSLLASMFLRKPESASVKKQIRIEHYLNIASAVFVVGLVFVAAAATQKALLAIADRTPAPVFDKDYLPAFWAIFQGKMPSIGALTVNNPDTWGIPVFLVAIVVLVGVTLLFAWRVDINKFSLHNMYKNRLVRCYLGASNQQGRNEQPFVGLDDDDDLSLHLLNRKSGDERVPQLPLPIINTTLNITQGADLAWQERKAASFAFTPLFCGYSLERTQGDTTSLRVTDSSKQPDPAYRPTDVYAALDLEEQGFTLGMALATSGAAVSPNMGRASMPMLAFVLTLFNIRLGRWSPNPAQSQWGSPSPRFGLLALLYELLGLSDERSRYVYLSDGGHFDNLGLYELVRRRCAVIIAVDASADEQREMTDLADTIRKCRVDLGVDIRFNQLNNFRGDANALCTQGYLIGEVHYDAQNVGKLVLIKPSLASLRNEPADVLNYAIQNPTFPHQTTADQFFDESQFESFRRLGKLIGEQCFDDPLVKQLLRVRKPAPPPVPAKAITEGRSHFTDFIGWLLKRAPSLRPSRDGSLVDLFLEMLAVTLITTGIFFVLDRTLFNVSSQFCFRLADCMGVAQQQFNSVPSPGQSTAGEWRVALDNLFVLLYLSVFLLGYKVGCGKHWKVWLLAVVPLVTALSDYGENFMILSWLNGHASVDQIGALAMLTWMKFCGFALSVILLVTLAPAIKRVFIKRWFG